MSKIQEIERILRVDLFHLSQSDPLETITEKVLPLGKQILDLLVPNQLTGEAKLYFTQCERLKQKILDLGIKAQNVHFEKSRQLEVVLAFLQHVDQNILEVLAKNMWVELVSSLPRALRYLADDVEDTVRHEASMNEDSPTLSLDELKKNL